MATAILNVRDGVYISFRWELSDIFSFRLPIISIVFATMPVESTDNAKMAIGAIAIHVGTPGQLFSKSQERDSLLRGRVLGDRHQTHTGASIPSSRTP